MVKVFSSYGGFWLSMAVIYIPGSGIIGAYAGSRAQLSNALGIYLITWFIATFIFLWELIFFRCSDLNGILFRLAALRTNIASIVLFSSLSLTFILLAVGQSLINPVLSDPDKKAAHFSNNVTTSKAGGAFGIVTALVAYYAGAAQLFTKQDSYLTLPIGNLWHDNWTLRMDLGGNFQYWNDHSRIMFREDCPTPFFQRYFVSGLLSDSLLQIRLSPLFLGLCDGDYLATPAVITSSFRPVTALWVIYSIY